MEGCASKLQLQLVGGHVDGGAADVLGLEERPGVGGFDVGAGGVLGGIGAADVANGEQDREDADVDADPLVALAGGVTQALDSLVHRHGLFPLEL